MKFSAAVLLSYFAAATLAGETPLSAIRAASARMAVAAKLAGVSFPFKALEVRVLKHAHRLEFWAEGRHVKSFRVGLSNRGLKIKQISGDHLTPEGRFYICSKSSQSAYHLFLGISYPDAADADRGLKAGLITKYDYANIIGAKTKKGCPPWGTGLGGTVGIHGHGGSSDWTWGCIALEDYEVDEVWASCAIGTPVVITP